MWKPIVVVVCVLVLLYAATMPVSADMEGWQYQREITIHENSGQTLVDYQVLLDLSGSSFPMNAKVDGSDLRFMQNTKELSYWIEEFNPTAKTGKVWMKVPSIPANGETTITMYYGNPSASAQSNGDATFEFFDDFENGAWTDKWVAVSGDYSETEGYLTSTTSPSFPDFEYIESIDYFDSNGGKIAVEADMLSSAYREAGIGHRAEICIIDSTDNTRFGGVLRTYSIGDNGPYVYYPPNSAYTEIGSDKGFRIDVWYRYKILYKGNGWDAKIWRIRDNYLMSDITQAQNTIFSNKMTVRLASQKSGMKWDNVKVRKYTSPEPTMMISSEMPTSTPPPSTPPPTISPTPVPTPTSTPTLTPIPILTPPPSTPPPTISPTPVPTPTSTPTLTPIPILTPTPSTPIPTFTPSPVPTPPIPPSYFIGAALIAIILIAGIGISRRGIGGSSGSAKPQPPREPPTQRPTKEKTLSDPVAPKPDPVIKPSPEKKPRVDISSAFGYRGATILYKIKVKNSTPEPVSDIRVSLFVPDVFLLKEKEKSIAMLEPNESNTVTFEIRPTGECGDCNVSGRVNYYDYSTKKRQEVDIETKSLSIVCPMLKSKEIEEPDWRSVVSRLTKAEENTKEIEMPAKTLFEVTSDILKDMNMFMLPSSVTETPQFYRATARFYGEGVKALKYAAQIEVVGGAKKSKLILKAWAEKEEALTGFYHGMLDELEKRVQVKDLIVGVNVFVKGDYIAPGGTKTEIDQIGNRIGTVVKDSVVQRSTIGGSAEEGKKCPNCGKDVAYEERICPHCRTQMK